MATIILAGWRIGLQKIALTKLQQELLALPLKKAKNNVDLLLDGCVISLDVADEIASEFFKRANDIGVILRFPVAGSTNQPMDSIATTSTQAA